MTPRPRTWRNWHPDDADVDWVLGEYPEGIDRNDLQVLAGQGLDTPTSRRRAFVATIMWGAGTTSRYQGRHRALLTDPQLPEALAASVEHLSSQRHPEAFKVLDPLVGITYRFHTKWLWVAGRAVGSHPMPLVFDNRVYSALVDLRWPGITKRQGMADRWLAYLLDAAALAKAIDASSEHVEYWLFNGGRSVE